MPPEPLPASAPAEVGVPDPGDDAGISDEAAAIDAPTADPDDIVSGEAADDSDTESADEVEPADEPQPEEGRGAADEPHEGEELDTDEGSEKSGDGSPVS